MFNIIIIFYSLLFFGFGEKIQFFIDLLFIWFYILIALFVCYINAHTITIVVRHVRFFLFTSLFSALFYFIEYTYSRIFEFFLFYWHCSQTVTRHCKNTKMTISDKFLSHKVCIRELLCQLNKINIFLWPYQHLLLFCRFAL